METTGNGNTNTNGNTATNENNNQTTIDENSTGTFLMKQELNNNILILK